MPNPDKIVGRIRANGANVIVDGGKLQIVNGSKLPDGARGFIKANARAIADFLEREHEVEERAAIMEHEGGIPRARAEDFARFLHSSRPGDVDVADWNWFVAKAAEAVEIEYARAA